jgi:hypothetical protein
MPTKLVVNVTEKTEEYVELTGEEIAEREESSAARQVEIEAEEAAEAARLAAKASGTAKLRELGLDDEEIAALIR